MNRNRVMLVVAFAAAGSFILSAAPDTVTIDGGQIAGTAADGVRVFKGIPFAAPPVGGLRWQAPRPVIAWKGVRAADTFGDECIQQPYSSNSPYARPAAPTSEDCLYLNVWSAASPGGVRSTVPAGM